ncbi:methyl-accepting chemotaxis protein [Massilia sp. TS11]|uniref:methyl-accepting chemotaxis protein n=1 Tax=Massilia sp. TS11 TaxID=2908003 RepID=UPI0027D9385E|nr:methyl-accepting chemotaxis protein [Massilia sp. TS11]
MNNFTISTRIRFLVISLSVMLVLIGAVGLWSTSKTNDAVQTVYADCTVPTALLASVNRQNLRNRIALAYAVMENQPDKLAATLKQIEENMAVIDKSWQAYRVTILSDEEGRLAREFETSYATLLSEGLRPAIAALRAGDLDQVRSLMLSKVRTLNTPTANALDGLIKLQSELARAEYEKAVARYAQVRNWLIAGIVVAVVLANLMGFAMGRSIGAALGQAVDTAHAVAGGDLSRTIEISGNDEVAELLRELQTMQASLLNLVGKVRHGADTVATASGEIEHANQDLSARTEAQASALEETAASMEELSSTVKQNEDNARQANQLAKQASNVAREGGDVVHAVVDTMQDISASSQRIADIINVIDGIAFQTNILALNAAVEAARAGEQGRGFAVVAGEVRSLASRSAEAAKEIKALITESNSRVAQGAELVGKAGRTMDEVVSSIQRVTDIMGEISAASSEQSMGVSQVGEAITQMDQATQMNAALVEEMAAASSGLRQEAQELVNAVAVFTLPAGSGRALAVR